MLERKEIDNSEGLPLMSDNHRYEHNNLGKAMICYVEKWSVLNMTALPNLILGSATY